MSLSQIIKNGLHFKTGFIYQRHQIVAMVHLTISIGNGRKIDAGKRETHRSRFKSLTIPERLHNKETTISIHHFNCALKNTQNLTLTETIEELAHPDNIPMAVGRKFVMTIKNIRGKTYNAISTRFPNCLILHQFYLLGQVNNGDFYVLI